MFKNAPAIMVVTITDFVEKLRHYYLPDIKDIYLPDIKNKGYKASRISFVFISKKTHELGQRNCFPRVAESQKSTFAQLVHKSFCPAVINDYVFQARSRLSLGPSCLGIRRKKEP